MISKAATVPDYLAELPPDRRAAVQAVREVILKNLGPGYEEGMQYGMIGYYVPHSVYPPGYHCDPTKPLPFASLASQKNHMAIYLMCIYGSKEHEAWFRKAWAQTGKKLDMGKSCIRFRKVDDVALDVVGEAIRRVPAQSLIAMMEQVLSENRAARPQPARKKTQKTSAKSAPAARARPAARGRAAAKAKPAAKAPARRKSPRSGGR